MPAKITDPLQFSAFKHLRLTTLQEELIRRVYKKLGKKNFTTNIRNIIVERLNENESVNSIYKDLIKYVSLSPKERYSQSLDILCLRYGNKLGKEKYQHYAKLNSEGGKRAWKTRILDKEKHPGYPEYWANKLDISLEEAKIYFSEKSRKSAYKGIAKLPKNKQNTCIEYYLSKGLSLEEARKQLSNRQTTFSLEVCVNKLGEEKGLARWKERQNRWLTNFKKSNSSNAEILLCNKLQEILQEIFDLSEFDFYHADTIKGQYRIAYDRGTFAYDFACPKLGIICEYNGVLFHADPRLTQEQKCAWKFVYDASVTYSDVLKKDIKKKEEAIKAGFDFYVFWEFFTESDEAILIETIIEDIKKQNDMGILRNRDKRHRKSIMQWL